MEQGFARDFSQLQDRQYHLVPGVICPYNWAFSPDDLSHVTSE